MGWGGYPSFPPVKAADGEFVWLWNYNLFPFYALIGLSWLIIDSFGSESCSLNSQLQLVVHARYNVLTDSRMNIHEGLGACAERTTVGTLPLWVTMNVDLKTWNLWMGNNDSEMLKLDVCACMRSYMRVWVCIVFKYVYFDNGFGISCSNPRQPVTENNI